MKIVSVLTQQQNIVLGHSTTLQPFKYTAEGQPYALQAASKSCVFIELQPSTVLHQPVETVAFGTLAVDARQVATIDDPATARLGESLYRFVPRSVAGNWKDATRLELARLHTQNQTPLSAHNRCGSHAACLL